MSEYELNKIIAENLNNLMAKNNVTQLELAEYMNVTQSAVSNWCKAIKTPRMDKIDKICSYFGVTRSTLMDKPTDKPHTIAAHFEGEEFTEEELKKIKEFVDFVKSQR